MDRDQSERRRHRAGSRRWSFIVLIWLALASYVAFRSMAALASSGGPSGLWWEYLSGPLQWLEWLVPGALAVAAGREFAGWWRRRRAALPKS